MTTATSTVRSVLSFEWLQIFVLTAQRGTITAAALELKLSPSLATRKLAQLERHLNVRLFQRTTRRLELTEAGRMALTWASTALEAHDGVLSELTALTLRPSGLVRLHVNHYAADTFLPPLIAQFHALYPDIRLNLSVSDRLVDLIEGGFDLAIHSGRIPDSRLVGVRVREFDRVVCASPDYVALHGKPTKPSDLADHDCLVHATNEPLNWFFRKGSRLLMQSIDPFMEADSHTVLLALARQSLGIVRLGRNMVKDDLAAGRLVALLREYKSVYSTGELPGLWLVYPNRKVLYRTRLLIDFLSTRL
jgi:LysR family transcriptional activator of dmlA